MALTSPLFLFVFLPVFMLVYHIGQYRARLILGILGSLVFYAWGNLAHLPLVLGLTLVTYGLARGMDRWRAKPASGLLLWVGIILNVGLLIAYKQLPGQSYPLGLSYLTFQAIAYLIEVHGRRLPDDGNLLTFSSYLLLFPKIPAGPIARYSQMQAQLASLRPDANDVADGLRRFIRGLAKKALLADTLGRLVQPIFLLPSPTIHPAWAWLVLLSYALQLYFDFSGYTDMAIGLGRTLGVTFPENFDYPYLSRSVADFWRRWHISLSSWFRDFVFYPLERRRLKWIGQPLNFLIVFLLVGLWHGQTANFIIWGLLHGLAMAFGSTSLGRRFTALPAPVGNTYALGVILVGWVFFRSPTPGFALDFVRRLLGDLSGLKPVPFELTSPLPFLEPTIVIALLVGLVVALPVGRWLKRLLPEPASDRPIVQAVLRLATDVASFGLLFASIAAITASSFAPGIYTKF